MPHSFKQLIGIILLVVCSTNCGCATLFNSVNFKNAPRDSFVKVEVLTDEYASTGSGVIINHVKDLNTIIITAGHICHDNTIAMRVLDIKENTFDVLTFVKAEKDDLCLLVVDGIIDGKSIKLASNSPQTGDHTYNIAAPMGIHAPDMELMFDGYYQGKLKLPMEQYPSDIYSIAGMGGSSGSPIFNDDWELVGIVSRGMNGFQHIMLSVEYPRVKVFYDYAFSDQFTVDYNKNMGNIEKKMIDFMEKMMSL
jgi:hypothetical protein